MMTKKMRGYVCMIGAMIFYAWSIYFDSHFLVQMSISLLLSACFLRSSPSFLRQFRSTIVVVSILGLIYGCSKSIFFMMFDWWIVRSLLIRLRGVGSIGYTKSEIKYRFGRSYRIGWLTGLIFAVIVGLGIVVSIFILNTSDDEQEITVLPTFDRISTFSTGQSLTNEELKTIISTGILPISGQIFFQTKSGMSDNITSK